VTSSHNRPPTLIGVVRTLDDSIVLYSLSVCVYRNTLVVQGNVDNMCVWRLRHTGLERRRNSVAVLGKNAHLGRKGGFHILSGHCLAGMNDIAGRTRDVESSLEHQLPHIDIIALNLLELDKEVNAVLLRRLPLVEAKPSISAALGNRRNGR
jgi:hypothetical protein